MARYLKQDSELGYIEDTAEIQYQKFNNLRHSIIGFMMGDFDQQGNYVISPEVKRELIAMPKVIVESLENIEICQSELKLNKHLSFMVTFEGDKATLSLLEKVNYEANFKLNSGSYSNINEYLLDEVTTSGTINRNAIYQRWNIKEFGGYQVDIFNCDDAVLEKYFGIVNRFKYLLVANKELLDKEEQIEEIESAYANKMLDILKAYPALNKAVTGHIKETLEEKKKFVCADEPNFAKTINEIIDKAIEINLDVLPEEKQDEFKAERRNVIVETNIKKQEVIEISEKAQALEKEDAKFNKEHDQENENDTKVVSLNTNGAELKETVITAAEKFAQANNNVEKRLDEEIAEEQVNKNTDNAEVVDAVVVDNTDNGSNNGNTERDQLIETIKKVSPEAVIYTADVEVDASNDAVGGEEQVEKEDGKKNDNVVDSSDSRSDNADKKGDNEVRVDSSTDPEVVVSVDVVDVEEVVEEVVDEEQVDEEKSESVHIDYGDGGYSSDDYTPAPGGLVGRMSGSVVVGINNNVKGGNDIDKDKDANMNLDEKNDDADLDLGEDGKEDDAELDIGGVDA